MTEVSNAANNASRETAEVSNAKAAKPRKTVGTRAASGSANKRTDGPSDRHMTLLSGDEKMPRSMEYLGENRIRVTGTVRFDEKSPDRYMMNSVFDFSNCSEAEILELASASVRITIQGRIRAMREGAVKDRAFACVDVKTEVVDAQKSTADEVTKAVRSLSRALSISESEARKLLEREAAKRK